ncbi:hypothetical protein CRUP_024403, partial [Coryphaenoides rupestris]
MRKYRTVYSKCATRPLSSVFSSLLSLLAKLNFRNLRDLGYLMRSSEVLAEQVVSTLVEEELSRWRLRQQLACIGAPQDSSLYKLQTWFTLAADALNVQLQQLRKLQEFDQQSPPIDNMPALRTQ